MIPNHLLSIVAYTPLVGALLLLFFDKTKKDLIRLFANIVAAMGFLVSIPLALDFDPTRDGFQFVERHSWIPALGVEYHFGIDGISLLLILLTTGLGFLSILSSWSAIEDRVKEYYIFMLLLQTGMLGVFMSLDFFLFYLFWEVMLVPMYFLIGVWGGPRKLYAAIKFFLYTLFGSVLMLLGILALYFYNYKVTGVYSFSIPDIQKLNLPWEYQFWVFLAFFVGFAIKVPMFPFHTWLPDAHVEAPTAGSVILAGVLLKMGTYGFVRFSLPMFPDAVKDTTSLNLSYFTLGLINHQFGILHLMVFLSIVGIVYGALVAMMQKDAKKLVAYSSVSHLGFCMLGLFALNPAGINGSIIQQINHGISTGALFLLVGIIYERRHTREISEFGGLSQVMPVYAAVFMIITMSSIGLPLLNGFIGEFTILAGAFQKKIMWGAWACLGIVLGAAYMLWLYQRMMFGQITNPKNEKLKDLNLREFATLLPLVLMAFWIGIYPKPFFRLIEKPVNQIVAKVQPGFFSRPIEQASQVDPAAHCK
ncbi:MAG: NADH-quinone oxidoreductase subunit M [Terriglobia bacterium]